MLNDSLVLFSKASLMLAEADTIQKAKELKDLALTAADFAKRRDMGREAIRYATSYAIQAERKMGEMLASTERAPVGRKRIGTPEVPISDVPTLTEMGITKNESSRAQKLATIPEDIYEQVLDGDLTINDAIKKHKNPHVFNNSGNNEWYTPIDIIQAARKVMGSIDLDPASSSEANKTVKAGTYYDIKMNGKVQDWFGNVWMNPPYAQPHISDFCSLVVDQYKKTKITSACVLVNNATETSWFRVLLGACASVCFPQGRVKFHNPLGESSSPLQGQAIIYIGRNRAAFRETFSNMGQVLYAEI